MGRGRSKGKTQKGKASGSSRHPEAARLHAQEVNAKRRADGKEHGFDKQVPEKGAAAPRGKGQVGACADREQVALACARHDGQGKG